MKLEEKLNHLYGTAKKELAAAQDTKSLEELKVTYFGRKGEITQILRKIPELNEKERPAIGRLANQYRNELEKQIENKLKTLKDKEQQKALEAGYIDLTLPGKKPLIGHKHLITQIIEEATNIFLGLGYKVAEGPEVEVDYYNFTALNTPEDHPARSLQDTFYIENVVDKKRPKEPVLLRTHTSPVQIRVMEKQRPPVFIIAPGKAYRRDVADPSHTPVFHQIEGLAVDENITFGDLKGTLEVFVKKMFGEDRAIRMRPHYFPFTEPSAEVDVSCALCSGKALPASRYGCRLCGGNGWLEILGCGMVDPNVLEEVGVDSEKYVGFAFGMGVERIAVLKYGLSDIRALYENDVRLLRQF